MVGARDVDVVAAQREAANVVVGQPERLGVRAKVAQCDLPRRQLAGRGQETVESTNHAWRAGQRVDVHDGLVAELFAQRLHSGAGIGTELSRPRRERLVGRVVASGVVVSPIVAQIVRTAGPDTGRGGLTPGHRWYGRDEQERRERNDGQQHRPGPLCREAPHGLRLGRFCRYGHQSSLVEVSHPDR